METDVYCALARELSEQLPVAGMVGSLPTFKAGHTAGAALSQIRRSGEAPVTPDLLFELWRGPEVALKALLKLFGLLLKTDTAHTQTQDMPTQRQRSSIERSGTTTAKQDREDKS